MKKQQEAYKAEDLKQFKKEDANYLMNKRQVEARKLDKLRATLHQVCRRARRRSLPRGSMLAAHAAHKRW